MTSRMMKRLGPLRADGASVTEDVTVTFRDLPGGDSQGEPSDGEGPVISGNSRFDDDNDDSADKPQSPINRYAKSSFC